MKNKMEKCKVKNFFILKNHEHGRDHNDLILTQNSQDVFWYYAQNKRVELMMEFWEGIIKENSKYIYKSSIGNISIEEFNKYFNNLGMENKEKNIELANEVACEILNDIEFKDESNEIKAIEAVSSYIFRCGKIKNIQIKK